MVHRILALVILLGSYSQGLYAQNHVLSASAALALGFPSHAQEPAAKDEVISIDFGKEGMKLDAFLEMAQEFTGLQFTYDSRQFNAAETIINLRGRISVPKSEIESFIQDICMAHQLVWHRLGTEHAALVEIIRLQTAQLLKQNAVPIAWQDVDSCSSRPAEVFTSMVPLEFIDCQQMYRSLSNLIQEHRASFVSALADANAVMICGTGRQMRAFAEAIRSAEGLAASERAKAWRVKNEAERALKIK